MASHGKIDFQFLTEQNVDMICLVGMNLVMYYASPSCQDLLGWTPEEMCGKGPDAFVFIEDLPIVAAAHRRLLIQGVDKTPTTIRMRKKDGTFTWMEVNARIVRNTETAEIQGIVLTMRDIAERKLLEEALRKSEHQFRCLSERLDGEVHERTAELQQRNTQIVRQSEELRELTALLMATQEQERRNIARELHDSAGQTLAVLGIHLGKITRELKLRASDMEGDAAESEQLLGQLSHDIRTTSYLLHPPLLDEVGLETAIQSYLHGLSERAGPQVTLEIVDGHLQRLPMDLEIVIFRVIQECLTNIIRHSGSRTATIKIGQDNEGIAIHVQDYGKGMLPEKLIEIQSHGSGVGIRGIRERVRHLGGEMQIESDPSGTKISIMIPHVGNRGNR